MYILFNTIAQYRLLRKSIVFIYRQYSLYKLQVKTGQTFAETLEVRHCKILTFDRIKEKNPEISI